MRPVKATAAITVSLLLPAIAACNERHDRVAQFDPPQLPVTVHDTLLIAGGRDRSGRPATLTLICTKDHQVHLLERTRLPGPHDELKVPWTDRATMFVGKELGRKLEVDAELIALGELDTILTPPLGPEQLDRLAQIFGPAIPQRVSFGGVAESAAFLTGKARGADIQEFTSNCAETLGGN